MLKLKKDPKVKKTLVRDCELNIKHSKAKFIRDTNATSSSDENKTGDSLQKDTDLSQPTLCSSGVLANYIYHARNASPPKFSAQSLKSDSEELPKKITKKLNFQFNDKIYKNLIELNASVENQIVKKDKRQPTTVTAKKDLEPNFDDFNDEEVKEPDSPPKIPVMRRKFKPLKPVERGEMHRLVSSFEVL